MTVRVQQMIVRYNTRIDSFGKRITLYMISKQRRSREKVVSALIRRAVCERGMQVVTAAAYSTTLL